MAALIECPICNTILKEDGDEMKVHKGTYNVYDIYNKGVDDDFIRIIKCNVCGFAGSTDNFSD